MRLTSDVIKKILGVKDAGTQDVSKMFNWAGARAEQKLRGVPVLIHKRGAHPTIAVGESKLGLPEVSKEDVLRFLGKKFGKGNELMPFVFDSDPGSRNKWIFQFTRPSEVTPHYNTDMVLITCVVGTIGKEAPKVILDRFAKDSGFSRPWSKTVNSYLDALDMLDWDISPLDEGIMVVSKSSHRIKLLNPVNKALRKFVVKKEAILADAAVLSMAGTDATEVIIKHHPEMKHILSIMDNGLRAMLTRINNHMFAYDVIEDEDDFMELSRLVRPQRLVHELYLRRVNSFHEAMTYIEPKDVIESMFERYHTYNIQTAMNKSLGKESESVRANKEGKAEGD